MNSAEKFLLLIGFNKINGTSVNFVYEAYLQWCAFNDEHILAKGTLSKAANKLFDMSVKRHRRDGKLISFYVGNEVLF